MFEESLFIKFDARHLANRSKPRALASSRFEMKENKEAVTTTEHYCVVYKYFTQATFILRAVLIILSFLFTLNPRHTFRKCF